MPGKKKGKEKEGKKPRMKCEVCGAVIVVEEPCGCAACDLICCGAPMKPC
ncbi:MAG: hypothetical protein QXH42_08370 [Thermoplasmata archaeon]